MNKVTELTGMSWLVTVPTLHLEISRLDQSHRTHRYVMAGHSTNFPSGKISDLTKVAELTGMSWLVTVPTLLLEISRLDQSHRTHRYVMAGHSTNFPSGNIPTRPKSQNSQVCHGWSQYQLSFWKYPDLTKVTELTDMSWLVTIPTLYLEIS